MRGLTYRIQNTLAKSTLLAKVAVKIRNQCNAIIGYHLGRRAYPNNGEQEVIANIAAYAKTVFDVGANVGGWTKDLLTASKNSQQHIWAFEPSLSCLQTLNQAFSNNHKVSIMAVALSANPGKLVFYENLLNNEHSSLNSFGITQKTNAYEVEVETIDRIASRLNLEEIGFLKVDCEGFDFHVLQGASALLMKGRIRWIQFEYGSNWQLTGSTITAAAHFLKQFGYTLYVIGPHSIKSFDANTWGEYFQYSNFLAAAPGLDPHEFLNK